MDHLSQFPNEILQYIFSLSDADLKNYASVSKNWNQAIKQELSSLFRSYTQNQSLKSYTDLAKKTYTLQDPKKKQMSTFKESNSFSMLSF